MAKLGTEREPRPDEDRAAAPYAQDTRNYHGMSALLTGLVPNTHHDLTARIFRLPVYRISSADPSLPQGILFKPPLFGAYSELFAALSPQVKAKHNGGFVVPWGRFGEIPDHIEEGLKPRAEGGTGTADQFWNWCERETKPYV